MLPIEIAPATPKSTAHNDEFADLPGALPDSGKKFGDLMDRTLARTGQKPADRDRDPQTARKTSTNDSTTPDTKVSDDADTSTDASSDDKHKVTGTRQKSDSSNSTDPNTIVQLQILPVTAEVVKWANTQPQTQTGGETKAGTSDDSTSVCLSPIDLQLASSRALLGLQTGNTAASTSAQTQEKEATTPALPATDAQTGKDPLAALAAADGKDTKAGHPQPVKGAELAQLSADAVPAEKADSTPKTLEKSDIGNSFMSPAELATGDSGQGDSKPDSREKPNKTRGPIVQNTGGISAAQQDMQMKKAEKKNKFAGGPEKVLPENAISPDSGENLPAANKVSATPVTFDRIERADNNLLNPASQNRPVEAASASVDKVSVSTSVVDIRARAVERAGDIMALHSMRLGDMSADSLKVTIRPGAGVELAVELHHGEKGIEATATLKNGDYHFLNSNWPDLQQKMEARGVRLSSLNNSNSSPNSNAGQFQQPRRQASQQQDDPAFAGAFADFVMAGSIAKQAVQTVSTRGFESWA